MERLWSRSSSEPPLMYCSHTGEDVGYTCMYILPYAYSTHTEHELICLYYACIFCCGVYMYMCDCVMYMYMCDCVMYMYMCDCVMYVYASGL